LHTVAYRATVIFSALGGHMRHKSITEVALNRRVLLFFLAAFCALALVCIGCGGGGSSAGDSGDGGESGDGGGSGATDGGTVTAASSGDIGIFVSLGESDASSITAGGSTITISEGTAYIYRILLNIPSLDQLDNTLDMTNNYSCDSAADQKPYTVGQQLYNIEVCPDIDNYDSTLSVEEINPSTGVVVNSSCSIEASGSSPYSLRFTAIDDTFYYIDDGGNLVSQSSACGGETTLLSSGDDDNDFTDLVGINGQLIGVVKDTATTQYHIESHSLTTGAISERLTSFTYVDDDDVGYNFWEGDDALYISAYDSDFLDFVVWRYPLSGDLTLILNVDLTDSLIGQAVDASGGQVMMVYKHVATRNDSDYATSWTTVGTIYTVASEASTTVTDIDEYFDALMQILVFE